MIARIFTLLFFVTAVACSCHKEPCKEVQPQIEGVWKQTSIPHSIYSFSDGICIQRVYAAGQEVWRNEYTYTFSADHVYLTDIATGGKSTWDVSFQDDNTLTAYDADLAFFIELRRII